MTYGSILYMPDKNSHQLKHAVYINMSCVLSVRRNGQTTRVQR